jgi:hypothetical protein
MPGFTVAKLQVQVKFLLRYEWRATPLTMSTSNENMGQQLWYVTIKLPLDRREREGAVKMIKERSVMWNLQKQLICKECINVNKNSA